MAELCEYADGVLGDKSVLTYPFIWTYNKLHCGRFSSLSAVDGLNRSGVPALIIHGDNDDVIKYYGASIISNQGRITNPNVQYYTFETEGKDTHNGFFHTSEYLEYYNTELKAADEALKNNKDATDEEIEAYFSSVDKEKFNAVNPDLINIIDDFLESIVGNTVPSAEPETETAETTVPVSAEPETSEETVTEESSEGTAEETEIAE